MHAMHAPGGFVWACGRLSGHATQERAELEVQWAQRGLEWLDAEAHVTGARR